MEGSVWLVLSERAVAPLARVRAFAVLFFFAGNPCVPARIPAEGKGFRTFEKESLNNESNTHTTQSIAVGCGSLWDCLSELRNRQSCPNFGLYGCWMQHHKCDGYYRRRERHGNHHPQQQSD